jgi:hypothetical protein
MRMLSLCPVKMCVRMCTCMWGCVHVFDCRFVIRSFRPLWIHARLLPMVIYIQTLRAYAYVYTHVYIYMHETFVFEYVFVKLWCGQASKAWMYHFRRFFYVVQPYIHVHVSHACVVTWTWYVRSCAQNLCMPVQWKQTYTHVRLKYMQKRTHTFVCIPVSSRYKVPAAAGILPAGMVAASSVGGLPSGNREAESTFLETVNSDASGNTRCSLWANTRV